MQCAMRKKQKTAPSSFDNGKIHVTLIPAVEREIVVYEVIHLKKKCGVKSLCRRLEQRGTL